MKNSKQYDLEDRTLEFARRVRALVKKLSRTIGNIEDGKQVVRSSGFGFLTFGSILRKSE